jgi:hypothetical protein
MTYVNSRRAVQQINVTPCEEAPCLENRRYVAVAMALFLQSLPAYGRKCKPPAFRARRGMNYYRVGDAWFRPSYGANGVFYSVVRAP